MKPDWKDAPDWATWLAQDGAGNWFWYSEEPVPNHWDATEWIGTRFLYAGHSPLFQRGPKEKRL